MHLRGVAAWHKRRYSSAGEKYNRFVLVDPDVGMLFDTVVLLNFRRIVGVECVTRSKSTERTLQWMDGA
jgi:hypothetical protein